MPKYFERVKGDKTISFSQKVEFNLRRYSCDRILGSLVGYWAAMVICRNAYFTSETAVKTQTDLVFIIL